MVVYPGETVTIGSDSEPNSIRSGNTIPTNYWNFAGFTILGQCANAMWGSNYWRWVGNSISCPTGNGQGGCYTPIEATYLYTYGNDFNNMGVTGASAEYQGVYLATDSNYQDFGWNVVANANGCRGIQTHSAPNGPGTLGYNLYSISIHDNIIHDTACDGIVGDTLSPNLGPVTIYNNVFYNTGKSTPPEGTGDWSGLEFPLYTEAGPEGSGDIYVFNNTFYAWGLNNNPPYGESEYAINWGQEGTGVYFNLQNNLLLSVATTQFSSGVPYLGSANSSYFIGSNNAIYGAGTSSGESSMTGFVTANPNLTSPTTYNFVPLSGSPVIGAGVVVAGVTPFGFNNMSRDINGLTRPSTPSIGAYELSGAVAVNPPNPPTNLTVAVQ